MFKKELEHDKTNIVSLSDQEGSLSRRLQVDDTVLCECSGTAREVQNCLRTQLDEDFHGFFQAYYQKPEHERYRDFKDIMLTCATNGMRRILSLPKWKHGKFEKPDE